MSASEKLKALDGTVGAMSRDVLGGSARAVWEADWYMQFAQFGVALPQLVAVVEAAEAVRGSQAMTNVDTIPVATMVSLRQTATAALAALDKALP